MKNKNLYSILPAITACFLFLAGCASNTPSTPSNLGHHALYLDYSTVDTPSFIMEGLKPECKNNTLNYSLNVSLQITNKDQKATEYFFKDPSLKDETLGGQYKVTTQNEKVTVDPGMTGDISFSSTIPLSITEHRYKLSFDMNGYEIDYYLYEMPDELRTGWKVNYYVSGTLVNTETVKDNKEADYYVYESSNGLSYCDTWYIDEAKTTTFNYPRVVKSDMNIYGDEAPCFGWEDIASSEYAHLSSINHVSLNKQLEIPRYHENKEIEIGYAVIKNLDIIYVLIPITVRRIESGNFQGLRDAVIYYEGSEEEWKEIYKGKGTPSNLIFLDRPDSSLN